MGPTPTGTYYVPLVYTYLAKGTALVMAAIANANVGYNAIRIFLHGNAPTQIFFDVFVNGVQYTLNPANLPFNHATV